MDGTTNEHADIKAEGFPTLLFFPAEEGAKPILYEGGDRSLAVSRGLLGWSYLQMFGTCLFLIVGVVDRKESSCSSIVC